MKTRTKFSWDRTQGAKKGGNKFFVFQARRLMPLAFLLVLLIGLAFYGNFFNLGRSVGVSGNYGESLEYTTAASGDLVGSPQFWLAKTQEQWEGLKQELALDLPDYPFNPSEEIGVFSLNGEINSIEAIPRNEDLLVQVTVSSQSRYYHVITVPRQELGTDGLPVTWVFADEDGNVIEQIDDSNENDITGDDNNIENPDENEDIE